MAHVHEISRGSPQAVHGLALGVRAAFAVGNRKGNTVSAGAGIGMAYIGGIGEKDRLGISIAKIPCPGGDIPAGGYALVGKSHGLALAVVGSGTEMGRGRRVHRYRQQGVACAACRIGNRKGHRIDAGGHIGMRGVAAERGAPVAKVPLVGGRSPRVDHRAVGQKLRGAVHAAGAAEKMRYRTGFHIHRLLQGVAASVQVGDHQGYRVWAGSGKGMYRVGEGAAVLRARGGVAKVPVPGGDLSALVRAGVIRERGYLVLAVAPETEAGNRAVGYAHHLLVIIAAAAAVYDRKVYRVVALVLVLVAEVGAVGEVHRNFGRAVAEIPGPLLYVPFALRVGAQVGELRGAAQAVGRGQAEKCRGMGFYLHRMAYRVMAAVGVHHAQGYRIHAVGGVHMAGAVRRIVGGKGAVAKIPVPRAGAGQVVARKGEIGGVAAAGIVGGEIGDRNGVDDHVDGIAHHGQAVGSRVLTLNGILPGDGEQAETERRACPRQGEAGGQPVAKQGVVHPHLRVVQSDNYSAVALAVITSVAAGYTV